MVKIKFDIKKEDPKCVICGEGNTRGFDRVYQKGPLQLLPGGRYWTHMDCDGRGMSIFPFGKEVGL